MSDEKMAERFRTALPVYDTLADDEETLLGLEELVVGDMWDGAEPGADAEPYGRPTVERLPNMRYGWPLFDEHDQPILGEDGEQLTDAIKLHLIATGWAIRR